jgi:fumarate reductase subunit C
LVAEVKTYRRPYSGAWWLRRARTVAYMAREFTAVPIAAWWLWFLIEVARVRSGPNGYSPHMSTAFVVFSCVCLVFALFHSYTFLSLAGLILRIPVGLKTVPSRLISTLAFGAFFVASAIIAALLVYFGR